MPLINYVQIIVLLHKETSRETDYFILEKDVGQDGLKREINEKKERAWRKPAITVIQRWEQQLTSIQG